MLLVVVMAYATAAPAIGVAEFAPAARTELTAPPTTAPAAPASGVAGGGRRTTTTAPPRSATSSSVVGDASGAAPTTQVGRSRVCFGDPPRQAEDLQSPACLATMFEGDNGGATSRGVTSTEISVALPITWTEYRKHYQVLFDYLNQRYEFYGRRLKPVFVDIPFSFSPTVMRSLATNIASMGVFASTDYIYGMHPAFYQELARQKVVGVTGGYEFMLSDRTLFDDLHPYLWSVYPSIEQVWRNLADFACTALVGRSPSHADPSLRSKAVRKFGIMTVGRDRYPLIEQLVSGLSACGETAAVVQYDLGRNGSEVKRNALQALKDAGVTTVVCACVERTFASVVTEASRTVGYKPEWLTPMFSYSESAEEGDMRYSMTPEERSLVFGLTPPPRLIPVQAQPFYTLQGAVGDNDPGALEAFYRMMMILAAGIQAAGPNLTPETFAAGLMSMQFPNPGAGKAPYYQPSVGFAPGDHSFYDDYALAWWSESATSLASGIRGTWCYLDRGGRYKVGGFPANADARIGDPNEPCA